MARLKMKGYIRGVVKLVMLDHPAGYVRITVSVRGDTVEQIICTREGQGWNGPSPQAAFARLKTYWGLTPCL